MPVPLYFDVYQEDQPRRRESFSQDIIKIGTLANAHLRLKGDSVSRMHAVIEAEAPDHVCVVDLGSEEGTRVNGKKINKQKLGSGDEIRIGSVRLVLSIGTPGSLPAPEPPPAVKRGPGRHPAPAAEAETLRAEVARLRAQVAELQEELTRRALAQVPAAPADELLQLLRAAIAARADADPGQSIPLPVLRRDVGAPRQEFDRAILLLEQERQIRLIPVRFPELVDVECGIQVPERGLLYYVRAG